MISSRRLRRQPPLAATLRFSDYFIIRRFDTPLFSFVSLLFLRYFDAAMPAPLPRDAAAITPALFRYALPPLLFAIFISLSFHAAY
jgi:hypothetical protein